MGSLELSESLWSSAWSRQSSGRRNKVSTLGYQKADRR
jgi:hypothetical protein